MPSNNPTRNHSSINPFVRYGFALIASWSGNFMALFPWLFSVNPKGGAPFMVVVVFYATALTVVMLLGWVALRQFLRIPSFGRLWFGSRTPATVCIVAAHLIYFTCFAIFVYVPERVYFPTGSGIIGYGLVALSSLSVAVFGFGFSQFPYLRGSASLPKPSGSGLFPGAIAVSVIVVAVAVPLLLFVYSHPPTKPPVAGTYTRSHGYEEETLILKADETFHQSVKYPDGKNWVTDGAWKLNNIMLELHGSYKAWDSERKSVMEPPPLTEEIFVYYGDQLEEEYGSVNSYRKITSGTSIADKQEMQP